MLRSERWVGGLNVSGLLHRASLRAGGAREAGGGKPIVGICNSWSELVHCNVHLRATAHAVKRGVLEAGGVPVEFPTISLSENLMKPTAMLYRNLMAMDVEEMIRSHPLDAVVLLGSCDKTVPAQLMGAISAGVPAIMLTGGPSDPAHFRGRELGVGTDLWHYTDDVRAGRMSMEDYAELEAALIPTHGHCNEMGTAATMASLCEALGIALPGTALLPAVDAARADAAIRTGARAVELARDGIAPRALLSAAALDNAIAVLMAIGGSTNAVVHLLALAGRLGIELPLERFAAISARTPLLVNARPSGEYLTDAVHRAGGIPAVMAELGDLLDREAPTVTGRSLAAELAGRGTLDDAVIARRERPFEPRGAITTLRGNLAPRGAVIKRSAASPELLAHRGPAVVFDGIEDLLARFDDPELPVSADSVLVLRGVGPRGAPGMPEWGMLPIPSRLLRAGVTDMVRISDARMSGTAYGTVVLHAAPEAAVGGPLALVRDGDPIVLDVDAGLIALDVPDDVLAARSPAPVAPAATGRRGYTQLYQRHVLQADQGCDFDFLLPASEDGDPTVPPGLFDGWVAGW